MIRTVGNQPYDPYEKCSILKKELEKNTEVRETSIRSMNGQQKQYDMYCAFQYMPKDESGLPHKDEWEKFIERISTQQETCGKVMANGYMLENYTIDEMAYKTQQQWTKETVVQENKNIKQKIQQIQNQRDSIYYYGVQHQGIITLNDLYRWSYGGGANQDTQCYSESQIMGILERNKVDVTRGNMQAVEKLLGLGLEVTTSHITKIQNLETELNRLQQYELDQIKLEGTTPLLEKEKILYTQKDIEIILDDLTKMDDQVIGQVIGESKEITIGNLREVLHKNTKKALGQQTATQVLQENIIGSKIDGEGIKEQVREIRAKLNVETAQKISEKMPIESTELSKIAKALTEGVSVQVEEVLKDGAVEVTPENKEQVTRVIDAVVSIGRQKALAIKMQSEDSSITVEQIHQAVSAYEEQALQPNSRFGENLACIEGQIETYLEEQKFAVTPSQIDAAKALLLQELPLTQENLESVKPIVVQMNTFLQEMTPTRIVSLIKEGINPYKACIESLLEWVSVERLPELKQSLGEVIYALESKGKIDSTQKQSLLGAYRILEGVERQKFEVVGYLYKNQLPLTMAHLEEAVRYIQKEQCVAVKIDDAFGMIETIQYTKQTARMMLQEAKQKQDQIVDYIKILEQIEIPLESERTVKDYTQLSQKIYPFLKKELKTKLENFKGVDTLPDTFREKLEVAKKITPDVIRSLERYQIPITLNNIYWMQKLYEEPNLYEKFLRAQEKGKKAFPESLEDVKRYMQEEQEVAQGAKELAMASGDLIHYKQQKQFEEMVTFQKQLMEKEGLYQIPFIIEGERKMVQLYIKENSHKNSRASECIKVAVSYDTRHLGQVNAYLEIGHDQIKYEVYGQNQQITEQLRKEDGVLKRLLEQIGYVLLDGKYQTDAQKATVVNPMPIRGDSKFEAMV